MDYCNLSREDVHAIDMMCLDYDPDASDMGQGLDYALVRFADRHGLDLSPDELYTPTLAEFTEIVRLTVNEITGGCSDV